jgi:uncharacterized protein with HEPN domain
MKKEYGDYLEDIIDSMSKTEKFTEHLSYDEFIKDDKTIFAIIRALEIIGEAVKNIPETLKAKYPDIPWRDMAGMRDKLIHEYSGVKLDLVWKTVKEIIPSLKQKFQKILDES